MAATVKFPKAHLQLVGEDGNAFVILGRAGKALRQGGATEAEIAEFRKEAMSGNYDHVLQTVMSWMETS